MNHEKASKENPALNTVVAVLLVLFVGFIIYLFINGSNNAAKQEDKPSLNLNVSRDITGISVKNNDSSPLTGCTIRLNTKYSTKVETLDSEEKTYTYSDFTDSDGTRFDYESTQPQAVYISDCKEDPERYGAYEW